jgi:hypothetical protein
MIEGISEALIECTQLSSRGTPSLLFGEGGSYLLWFSSRVNRLRANLRYPLFVLVHQAIRHWTEPGDAGTKSWTYKLLSPFLAGQFFGANMEHVGASGLREVISIHLSWLWRHLDSVAETR